MIIQQIVLQRTCHAEKRIPIVDIQLLGMTDISLYGFPVLGDCFLGVPGKGFKNHGILSAGDADDVLMLVKGILFEFRDQFFFAQFIVPEDEQDGDTDHGGVGVKFLRDIIHL